MTHNRILFIEDDREINKVVTLFLLGKGYDVLCAYNGTDGIEMALHQNPDLVLLDMMLPFQSGDKVLDRIQQSNPIPTIIVSAKSMTQTKVDMLRLGADDYVTKPFDMNELLARIEALLKRSYSLESSTIQYGELLLECVQKTFFVNDIEIPITAKEYYLLELFLSNPSKVFSKQNLYESVWKEEYAYDNDTINTHISNLRRKLKDHTRTEYIQTVWGLGYKLRSL